jgi:hypothetical protein
VYIVAEVNQPPAAMLVEAIGAIEDRPDSTNAGANPPSEARPDMDILGARLGMSWVESEDGSHRA